MPTYTVPEAAAILAIPSRTLLSWYEGVEPLLTSRAKSGNSHLLSYEDMEETYRLHLLRQVSGHPMQTVRTALRYLRRLTRSAHPLKRADALKSYFSDLVFDKPARGRSSRTVTSLGDQPGQMIFEQLIDLYGQRIVGGDTMFPWRYAKLDQASRPVSVSPDVMSGRLVVADTRIPVTVIASERKSGKSVVNIATEYGVESGTVEKALQHLGLQEAA